MAAKGDAWVVSFACRREGRSWLRMFYSDSVAEDCPELVDQVKALALGVFQPLRGDQLVTTNRLLLEKNRENEKKVAAAKAQISKLKKDNIVLKSHRKQVKAARGKTVKK